MFPLPNERSVPMNRKDCNHPDGAFRPVQEPVYSSLEEAVRAVFGPTVTIVKRERVGGGDINEASCLTLSSAERVFVKSNTAANRRFFETESLGLRAIAATGTISTPKVLGRGVDQAQGKSFLLLEQLPRSRGGRRFWEDFGHALAALHRADTHPFVPGGRYGFLADNFIGATPQSNAPGDSWADFFRSRRLEPQFRRAQRWFDASTLRRIDTFLDRLDSLLPEPEHPSLLHGDLWSGNYLVGPDGQAWLIDPAVYVGHAEADLAMTELFGGFAPAFYAAYRECSPLEAGYEERRTVYNLYHLLNHLNLFGGGYLGSVRSSLSRFC